MSIDRELVGSKREGIEVSIANCDMYLMSTVGNPNDSTKEIQGYNYSAKKITHPGKGSEFEKTIGRWKYLFRIPILGREIAVRGMHYLLNKKGYDVMILRHNEKRVGNVISLQKEVIGHTALQKHGNDWHVFSIEIEEGYRGKGLAFSMAKRLLGEARQRGIDRIRLGGGRNDAVNSICARLVGDQERYQVIGEEGNWLRLVYD